MKENELINEFIKNVYTDNFAEAEVSLRSVVEEKVKNKMKKLMKKDDDCEYKEEKK
jgi:hypothetical protein